MDEQTAQYSVKNVHVFVPVFFYAVTMLIFQIKRIISSEKRLNYVVTFIYLFIFFGNAKNVGRSDDSKRRKKNGMALRIKQGKKRKRCHPKSDFRL